MFTQAVDFSVGVASDYVFRGISQSSEDPSARFGFNYQANSSWYVKGFIAEVDNFNNASTEVDVAIGFADKIDQDFSYSFEADYSLFTDETGNDSDYLELNTRLNYKDSFKLLLSFSNDYFGTDESNTYLEAWFNLPLHDVFDTAVFAGLSDSKVDFFDYTVFGAEASAAVGEILISVGYTDTDINNSDIADSRIYFKADYRF
jgi:uncharacterized protein (TIGR02001 family)